MTLETIFSRPPTKIIQNHCIQKVWSPPLELRKFSVCVCVRVKSYYDWLPLSIAAMRLRLTDKVSFIQLQAIFQSKHVLNECVARSTVQ